MVVMLISGGGSQAGGIQLEADKVVLVQLVLMEIGSGSGNGVINGLASTINARFLLEVEEMVLLIHGTVLQVQEGVVLVLVNTTVNPGTANTGGGGGATGISQACSTAGGNGGSGVVIIRYKYQN